jgi:hypothetical protein
MRVARLFSAMYPGFIVTATYAEDSEVLITLIHPEIELPKRGKQYQSFNVEPLTNYLQTGSVMFHRNDVIIGTYDGPITIICEDGKTLLYLSEGVVDAIEFKEFEREVEELCKTL